MYANLVDACDSALVEVDRAGHCLLGPGAGHVCPHDLLRPLGGEYVRRAMLELVLGAIVAAVIGLYLLYALLHPEKL